MNIERKTILLTGTRRIGQTVSDELGKKGPNLAIAYLTSAEEAKTICQKCQRDYSCKAKAFRADLSKEKDIKNLITHVKKEFGRIDGLVHMAAPYPRTLLETVAMTDFTSTQGIIGGSAMMLAKYVIPIMLENEGDLTNGDPPGRIKGKIIFFSDWSVLTRPYPEHLVYNMAKAGINSLVKSLARQFGPLGITVNGIAPGPMLRPPDLTEEANKETLAGTPLGRWGGAEEIAKVVLYLLDADFMTGQILKIDGGRSVA